MSFAAVGSLIQGTTSSLSLSPANVGDLILIEVINASNNTVHCSGVSGGGCTWTQLGTVATGVTNSRTAVVFAGKVTATGSATATITWSGTAPANIRITGHEYFSSVGVWAIDQQGMLDSAGTATMPSLTPAGAGELYFAYELDSGTAVVGSTTGYSYAVDAHSNGVAWNAVCTASAQAPSFGDSTCTFGLAVLVKEVLPVPASGFNQDAVHTLFDSVVSMALTLGIFESVNQHEPKSAPGSGIRAACWVQSIQPVGRASGLNATSGVVTLYFRLYSNFLQMPLDGIDPDLLTATTTVLGAFSGSFTLGGTVRDIDLLGMYGASMGATAGYASMDSKVYRIMTVTLPVIINDLWTQGA